MKTNAVLVRFGEIGLKGKNRPFFERRLINNIKLALESQDVSFSRIFRIQGRLVILTHDQKTIDALKYVFGVVSFSPALMMEMDMGKIKGASLEILRDSGAGSFRVSARRLDKNLRMESQQTNELIGECLAKNTKAAVMLKEPSLDIGIDMTLKSAFIFTETFRGLGGLPVGVSGKVLCFLSGGIDSPVAAWLSMKRGCECVLVHFLHGADARPAKIISLCKILRKYQPRLKLLAVPMEDVERELIKWVPASYRIVILRRMFLLMAERLMEKEGASAVVTGDSIGQVASQTIHNMAAIGHASGMLVLRPLAGYDKEEIIQLATRIGTYKTSIEPYPDCCNFLLPKHPETRADIRRILEAEKNIDLKVVEKAIEKAVTID